MRKRSRCRTRRRKKSKMKGGGDSSIMRVKFDIKKKEVTVVFNLTTNTGPPSLPDIPDGDVIKWKEALTDFTNAAKRVGHGRSGEGLRTGEKGSRPAARHGPSLKPRPMQTGGSGLDMLSIVMLCSMFGVVLCICYDEGVHMRAWNAIQARIGNVGYRLGFIRPQVLPAPVGVNEQLNPARIEAVLAALAAEDDALERGEAERLELGQPPVEAAKEGHGPDTEPDKE